MNETLDRILKDRLIAVVRTDDTAVLPDVVRSLVDGGVTIVEITLTIPGAVAAIRELSREWQGRAIIGAGTVRTADDAKACATAGAMFLVSPIVNPEIVPIARSFNLPVMLGAYTPTEIVTAWQAGADIVKLFPAETLGPSYLKAVRGPLPDIRLMPTGGVDLSTIPAWLAAGACCLGVGSQLVPGIAVRNRDWLKITALARQFRSLVPPE